MTRLGKKTCPIKSVNWCFDFNYNTPWKEYAIIEFKDGTKIELIEKPKLK